MRKGYWAATVIILSACTIVTTSTLLGQQGKRPDRKAPAAGPKRFSRATSTWTRTSPGPGFGSGNSSTRTSPGA